MGREPDFAQLDALADKLGLEHVAIAERQIGIAHQAVSSALGKLLPLIGAPAAQGVAVCRDARDQLHKLDETLSRLRSLVERLATQDPTVSEDYLLSQQEARR